MGDRRVIGFAFDGAARVMWIEAGDTVREVVRRHRLEGRAARLAADLVVANVLLSNTVKGEERVQLQVRAEDPADAQFMGEMAGDGTLRARFSPPQVPGEGNAMRGVMLAIKADAKREMYRGVTEVADESVAASLERHLRQSAQVRAAVRIVADPDLERVTGLLVERLPGDAARPAMDPMAFEARAAWVAEVDGALVRGTLDEGKLGGDALEVLDVAPLAFGCRCSLARVQGMLAGLGAEELTSMIEEDGKAEITCHFCEETYRVDREGLETIRAGVIDA